MSTVGQIEKRTQTRIVTLSKQGPESPRILRRLQPLRRWSHEQEIKQIFPASP
jgi:hypothetical protein